MHELLFQALYCRPVKYVFNIEFGVIDSWFSGWLCKRSWRLAAQTTSSTFIWHDKSITWQRIRKLLFQKKSHSHTHRINKINEITSTWLNHLSKHTGSSVQIVIKPSLLFVILFALTKVDIFNDGTCGKLNYKASYIDLQAFLSRNLHV